MIVPINELLDEQASQAWVEKHFHPQGLRCPGCQATPDQARELRRHKRGLVAYRCRHCQHTDNLYTGTLCAGSNLEPRRVVVLVRGVCQGEPAPVLAAALALSRQSVDRWRNRLQAKGCGMLSQQALPDGETETDEMVQHAGEKRRSTP